MQHSRKKRIVILCIAVGLVVMFGLFRNRRRTSGDNTNAGPTQVTRDERSGTQTMSMKQVLDMAVAARAHLSNTLDDYTARFVKQEVDAKGVLGEETELLMKVQTRLRGDSDDAPMRVFLSFQAPAAVKGRKVIWGEDLYNGKMAVHEVGLLLSLKTLWLDPNGIFAMQGQRYPISEIGLVRLVEKLIERGEKDRDNPDITVTMNSDHKLDDTSTQLIQVSRSKPSNAEDDFSLAEIVIDPERQLILSYRSFGWPQEAGGEAPLLESYIYYDVKTNVGLTDTDFDVRNPEYEFPSF